MYHVDQPFPVTAILRGTHPIFQLNSEREIGCGRYFSSVNFAYVLVSSRFHLVEAFSGFAVFSTLRVFVKLGLNNCRVTKKQVYTGDVRILGKVISTTNYEFTSNL